MAGPAVFFVPLAIAGGKVFFKFASKKAAEVFKKRFAKAGNVTTRTPPKNATVTTTGSSKGKSIVQDLTKPVTQPRVSPRNPNTSTLPKPPKSSGGGKAAGAAAAGAGVAAGSTATGKDADKPKKSKPSKTSDQARDEAPVSARQRRLAAKSEAQGGGSVLSNKKKKTTSKPTAEGAAAKRMPKKTPAKPTPPPPRPKKNDKPASTTRPTAAPSGRKTKKKMYTAINTRTGKPDYDAPRVTAAQRLKQEDQYKKFKKDSAKFKADATREYVSRTAKKNMNKGGAALKSVPAGNSGLKKLPTPVRNRMGFMRKGGVAKRK